MSEDEAFSIPDIEAVFIETTNSDLMRVAGECAERGIPMHCDKPCGLGISHPLREMEQRGATPLRRSGVPQRARRPLSQCERARRPFSQCDRARRPFSQWRGATVWTLLPAVFEFYPSAHSAPSALTGAERLGYNYSKRRKG